MRKAFVLIASLAVLVLIAPVAPSTAAQAASVPKTIQVSAPHGANQACPQNTVKVFMATANIRRGHINRPGTFTLVLKNGTTRTVHGSVVAGTKRRVAEYFVFVDRNVRVKSGQAHSITLNVSKPSAVSLVQLTKDCLEAAQ